MALLDADEPHPVRLMREAGSSGFLLTADHAGRHIPRALGDLGVSAAERARHIGWDIGIAGVTERLAERLDATAILQVYSRLVIDCNRPPNVASAFPELAELTPVPGNVGLDEAARTVRQQALFEPYHAAIGREIEARRERGQATIYVAMHSFTPVFKGERRAMEVAVLYHRNPRFSRILAGLLRAEGGFVVAENEPYQVSDETDYGVPVHAERSGLDYAEIEIRQDLIEDAAGQDEWAARFARLLPVAAAQLAGESAS